jgi:hypothetical protein
MPFVNLRESKVAGMVSRGGTREDPGHAERPEITDHEAVIGDQRVEATGVPVYQADSYGTGRGSGHPAPTEELRELIPYGKCAPPQSRIDPVPTSFILRDCLAPRGGTGDRCSRQPAPTTIGYCRAYGISTTTTKSHCHERP